MSTKEALGLSGLLFDLDDTFLDRGRLLLPAYDALARLAAAGLRLGVVTGRPASLGRVVVTQWPVDFAITENGAVAFVNDRGRALCLDASTEAERTARRERLAAIAREIELSFGISPTEDNPGRMSDFSLDIAEFANVEDSVARAAEALARARGAFTLRSSIHLHLSHTGTDKASGAVRLLHERFGEDPTASLARYAFIGDSENDAACFAAFHTTIAVANLSGRPSIVPRFVTRAARAEGFKEAADTLLGLRERGTGRDSE
jgi:HAD superfamily hydrolase (TIGR01484 family)